MSSNGGIFDLVLHTERGNEGLSWDVVNRMNWKDVVEMDPDTFAALCIVVRREWNRRERENGFRLPLEEE